jgi:glycosyltransferase involved in cell wall biosynthesis
VHPSSIIVTAYNLAPVIGRTLQSAEDSHLAFQSSMKPGYSVTGEIVVVDDGSTDDTLQAIKLQAADRPYYLLISQPKATSSSCARDVGAKASTGSVLFFLDGDDLFYSNHISVCQEGMQSPGVCSSRPGFT